MGTRFPKRLAYTSLMILGIWSVTFSLTPGQTKAESNWFEKGTSLLKTFGQGGEPSGLSVQEIGAGLKEALRVGSENVVTRLGRVGGFNNDAAIHIPLPDQLNTVKSVMEKVGMSDQLEDLEVRLNRAAEKATPKAKELFIQAINEMSFDDVKEIFNGPKDAATQYFRRKMSPALAEEMKPLVENSLGQVKAIQTYDSIMETYRSFPFVPNVKADLTDYVVEKGMDGIFYYMAREEAAIRTNPAKRTTDLLKRVFGAN